MRVSCLAVVPFLITKCYASSSNKSYAATIAPERTASTYTGSTFDFSFRTEGDDALRSTDGDFILEGYRDNIFYSPYVRALDWLLIDAAQKGQKGPVPLANLEDNKGLRDSYEALKSCGAAQDALLTNIPRKEKKNYKETRSVREHVHADPVVYISSFDPCRMEHFYNSYCISPLCMLPTYDDTTNRLKLFNFLAANPEGKSSCFFSIPYDENGAPDVDKLRFLAGTSDSYYPFMPNVRDGGFHRQLFVFPGRDSNRMSFYTIFVTEERVLNKPGEPGLCNLFRANLYNVTVPA